MAKLHSGEEILPKCSTRGIGTGGHRGHVPPHSQPRGTSHALVPPPHIVMKLIDCFGLLCNLSLILLF